MWIFGSVNQPVVSTHLLQLISKASPMKPCVTIGSTSSAKTQKFSRSHEKCSNTPGPAPPSRVGCVGWNKPLSRVSRCFYRLLATKQSFIPWLIMVDLLSNAMFMGQTRFQLDTFRNFRRHLTRHRLGRSEFPTCSNDGRGNQHSRTPRRSPLWTAFSRSSRPRRARLDKLVWKSWKNMENMGTESSVIDPIDEMSDRKHALVPHKSIAVWSPNCTTLSTAAPN